MRSVLGIHVLLLSVLAWTFLGCGESVSSNADTGSQDISITYFDIQDSMESEDTGNGTTEPPDVPVSVIDNEAFKILYTYEERFENCDPDGDPLVRESDLYIIWPDGTKGESITNLSLKSEGTTCQAGCFTDREMTWIAIGKPVTATGAFDFELGKFTPSLEAKIVKGFELNQVIDFAFGGEFLFFSRLTGQDTSGPGGKYYTVSRVPLENPGDKVDILPEFPTIGDRPNSTYQGHFRVEPTGQSMVLLNPTIGSQQVFHWREGIIEELHKICPDEINGACISSGSQYGDLDPLAVGSDGVNVAAVFQNGDALTIYRYDMEEKRTYFNNLVSIPVGSTYETASCYNTPAHFPWVRVLQAEVSVDGEHVLLLVSNDCLDKEKEETDIVSIPLAAIGDGTPIDASDIRNITNNPKGKIADNVIIESFDLSPDGQAIVFAGSPYLDTDGVTKLGDQDQRGLQDRELYLVTMDGKTRNQLSNNGCYKTRGPMAVVPYGSPPSW